MFTWICPKCGTEVPPAYSDCPNCAAKAQEGARAAPGESVPAGSTPAEAASVAAAPTTPPPAVAPAPVAPVPVSAPTAPPSRRGTPWLSALAAMAVVAAVLAGIYFLVPKARNTSAAAPVEQAAAPVPQPAVAAHPLANSVELTGFRLTQGRNQRVQVRFIAVNHTGAELPETKLQVSLKRDREEIMDFPFTLPSLGPYESREITATTTTRMRGYEMPDWQFLRADFTDAPQGESRAR